MKSSLPVSKSSLLSVERLFADEESALDGLSLDELLKSLARCLTSIRDQLVRMAAIVKIIEGRGEGERLNFLSASMHDYLRRIAHGQVWPDLVSQYHGQPTVLRMAMSLPLPDQIRIAENGTFKLAVPTEDGKGFTDREVEAQWLTVDQWRQLVGPHGLRPPGEQIVMLEGKEQGTAPPRPRRIKAGVIVVERERGGLLVGRTFLPSANVIEALALLASGEDDDDDELLTVKLGTNLTPSEAESLKLKTFKAKTTVSRMIRRALLAAGLLASTD